MSDQDCNCADISVASDTKHTANTDGWIAQRPAKTAQLPAGVAANMSRFFDASIESFDDVIAAIRNVVEGDGIAIEELCHVEGETSHYAKTATETYYFRCFYDGIALAHLVNEPVKIRTETPTSESIEIQASPESEIDITPPDAVMSFGVATDREIPAGNVPTTQEAYKAICPYVKAFHTRADYERWSDEVAATTVGIPLAAGVGIARALTATSPSEAVE